MAEMSPAYLMYPDDILASGRVNALAPLEELWYRRALDYGWKNEGMPIDPEEFAGWIGRGCTVEAAQKIITKFYRPHPKDPDKVVNERQEKERKLFLKKRRQKSNAGKQGMRNRWKQKICNDNSVITENNIPIPISISISKEKEPPTPKGEAEVNRNGNGHRPRNQGNNREVDNWLDAIASSLGAKNKNTIADVRGWSDTCAKAIQDGKAVTDLLDAITTEKERNRETPQFFTPKAVLKILQLQSAKTPLKKFDH